MKNSIKFGLLIGALLFVNGRGSALDKPSVYNNTLTLSGHPLDQNSFWLHTRGVLAIVGGDPRSSKPKPMLFRVSLRRASMVLRQWPEKASEGVYSLQLDEIWPYARLGDELIVEPVNSATSGSVESPEKRVIKLKSFNWLSHCLPVDNC